MAKAESVLSHLGFGPTEDTEATVRAIFLLYLTDWKGALELGRQISDSDWRKVSWGPFSARALAAVSRLRNERHFLGASHGTTDETDISHLQAEIIDDIAQKWRTRPLDEIIRIVSSTFPMVTAPENQSLDLAGLAQIYSSEFNREKSQKRPETTT
jgi:hypothetical protein